MTNMNRTRRMATMAATGNGGSDWITRVGLVAGWDEMSGRASGGGEEGPGG